MADPKHIANWLHRLDAMPWFKPAMSPEQHGTRRALYCSALERMTGQQLDAACHEWVKTGGHYPTPAELWTIVSEAERLARQALPPPEHRPASSKPYRPVIHDPAGMVRQLVEMRANPARYVGGPHLISIGETMLRRAGRGHLLDEPGTAT